MSVFCGAQAQQGDVDGSSLADRLEQQQSELESSRRREDTLKAQMQRQEGELAQLNKQLIETGQAVQNTEERLTGLEEKLRKLDSQEKEIRKRLSIENKSIYKLLAAAQRMGRNPPPVIVTSRSDALLMVRSGMQLRYLFPKFQGEISELQKELSTLVAVVEETEKAKQTTQREDRRLRSEQTRLAALIETKRSTFLNNREDLLKVREAVQRTARTIDTLSQRIAKNDKVVSEITKLGSYEDKRARSGEADQKPPADEPSRTNGKPPQKVADAAENQTKSTTTVSLMPSGSGQAANPGRLEPAIPFHLAKGRLPLPARGESVIKFDAPTPRGGRSKGIVIKTRHGASITSPCDGWVVYAGAFRSYGQLLIINAGGGYHVLLANLSRLDVQLGQFILAAEPVGSMAGIDQGRTRPSDPVLYVEFRKNGKPIDPNPWWVKDDKNRMQS
ncbi:MAG: peptidoglycan DD-metalloendopeptidase family protein [Pseudomonadota bacterium]